MKFLRILFITILTTLTVFASTQPRIEVDTNRSNVELQYSVEPGSRYRVYNSDDALFWKRMGDHQMPTQSQNITENQPLSNRSFFTVYTYPDLNFDADTLSNTEEAALGTDPYKHDTDGDTVNDDEEVALGTNPLLASDTDMDGLFDDFEEQIIRADPNDGITTLSDVDGAGDWDNDNRTNAQEQEWGTNPAYAEPNILLILPEDMGYYTSERALREPNALITGLSTPVLDTLAAEGINFTRTFVGQSICSPSKGAIYSGLAPHTNLIWRNTHNTFAIPYPSHLTPQNDPTNTNAGAMHDDLPNLITMLKANGVYCGLSGKLHVQPARNFPYDSFHGTGNLNEVIAAAGGRPWFFWSNPSETHAPFWASIRFKLVDGNDPNSPPTDVDPNAVTMPPWLVDTPAARIDLAQYYSNVQLIDNKTGNLLDKLNAAGEAANTIVMFSPDHGIPVARGKSSIYPAGTQVPFFIKGPGVSGGRTLNTPVSQMDFNPTILEGFGITPQRYCHGKSLWPILSGNQDDFADRNTILTETNLSLSSAPPGTNQTISRAVSDGRFYYIRNLYQDTWTGPESQAIFVGSGVGEYGDPSTTGPAPGVIYAIDLHDDAVRNKATQPLPYELLRQLCMSDAPWEELYDLDADPWATVNLADDPAYSGIKTELHAALASWRLKTEDITFNIAEEPRRVNFVYPEIEGELLFTQNFTGTGNLNPGDNYTTAALEDDRTVNSALVTSVSGNLINISIPGILSPMIVAAGNQGIQGQAPDYLENAYNNYGARHRAEWSIGNAPSGQNFTLVNADVVVSGVSGNGLRLSIGYRLSDNTTQILHFNDGANITEDGTYSVALIQENLLWTDSSGPLLGGSHFRLLICDPSTGAPSSGVIESFSVYATE